MLQLQPLLLLPLLLILLLSSTLVYPFCCFLAAGLHKLAKKKL